MSNVRQIRLTGRATRFVALLAEYGHLDADGVNRVLLAAAELVPDGHPAAVDIDLVRRAAAILLAPPTDVTGPLAEDWALLFS
ncbi:MAG: hypothetical protein H0V89_00420 [Deltaproteobacteria bacterium]|nr:hypothetical protein [Deltaproteobacteria bacterium]